MSLALIHLLKPQIIKRKNNRREIESVTAKKAKSLKTKSLSNLRTLKLEGMQRSLLVLQASKTIQVLSSHQKMEESPLVHLQQILSKKNPPLSWETK